MNFVTLLERHAESHPDAIAFHDVDQPVNWRALLAESQRVAGVLHARGARAGDRLALWLPNCTAWMATFMACARLGITVVSMNTRFRSREVGDLVSRSGARWLVLWPDFKGLPFRQMLADVQADQLKGLRGVMVIGEEAPQTLITGVPAFSASEAVHPCVLDEAPRPSGDTYALVYTTSGTTSQPKLVVHDQQTLIRHGRAVADYFGIGRDDVVLLGAPLCGAFGFSMALGGLAAGAPLVSLPILDPAQCAAQIRRLGVTHTFANNELLQRILDAGGDRDIPFPSLRLAGFASFAPSLEGLPERAEKAGIKMVGLYGSSELQALAAGQPPAAPLEQRRQAGGRLVHAQARVRARDIETDRILPHGETGEIEIRSPSLMREYLDNAQATADAIDADGYFRTGDLGHTVDAHSFIFLARRGDFLRLGGFLVNPLEIETFIEGLEGVSNCQVVGVPHQGRTVAVAFVIGRPGHSLQEQSIIAQCKARLAGFKVPARVAVVDTFPVVESANSDKIQRVKLQEQALELLSHVSQAQA